jgi:hypothetical protein
MIILPIQSGSESVIAHIPNEKLILWGISMAESAGSASTAEIVIRKGTGVTGTPLLAPVNFAADGFGYPTFFPCAIPCREGIFIERVSGETTIVLYIDYQ